jgi:hypothetical protein
MRILGRYVRVLGKMVHVLFFKIIGVCANEDGEGNSNIPKHFSPILGSF